MPRYSRSRYTRRRATTRNRRNSGRRMYNQRRAPRRRRNSRSGRSNQTIRIVIDQPTAPAVAGAEMIGQKPADAPKRSRF